jgi:hypothetical protein
MCAYWFYLPPLPRDGLPGEWINLATIESFIFDKYKERYVIRFCSGAYRFLENDHAFLLAEQFQAIAKPQLLPKPNRQLNKPT